MDISYFELCFNIEKLEQVMNIYDFENANIFT